MNLQGLNSILANIFFLALLISILSCSKNDLVNVVYQINEYHDNGFYVTFSINNTSSNNLDSPWSLHWNQQSSIIDDSSVKDNVKYEYVAGQYYSILSFGKDFRVEFNLSLILTLFSKAI